MKTTKGWKFVQRSAEECGDGYDEWIIVVKWPTGFWKRHFTSAPKTVHFCGRCGAYRLQTSCPCDVWKPNTNTIPPEWGEGEEVEIDDDSPIFIGEWVRL